MTGSLRPVTATAGVLRADNPSVMTLEGTNTWVLRAPGARAAVVVDPGPDDPAHLGRIAGCGPVGLVLLTHGHADHSAGARRFAESVDAPLRALDPGFCQGAGVLTDGEVITVAGLRLSVLTTPGHTADSVCLRLADAMLTGDTILGRGSTIVAHPDGTLGDYLDSLRALAGVGPGVRVLPGHGPDLPDLRAAATAYLDHRGRRLDQVRAALAVSGLAAGDEGADEAVLVRVYADTDRALWPAARLSVRAQLAFLQAHGSDQGPAG